MNVLGFDLVWTGRIGWGLFDAERGIFLAWGDFTPKAVTKGNQAAKKLKKAKNLYAGLAEPIVKYMPAHIAYEEPDFYNIESPIRESEVAAALDMAALTLLWLADAYSIPTREFGVKQVRYQFGAQSKAAVARQLAQEFPDLFEWRPHKNGFLMDRKSGMLLSHDISDAMAVAYVAGKEIHLLERIEVQNG